MSKILIKAPRGSLNATVQLPASKSISNRALIIKALAGASIENLSDAKDTELLEKLLFERPARMNCGMGGTTLRFLLAWAAIQEGEDFLITGEDRLLERPHDDLINALRICGAEIEKTPEGFHVQGKALRGGTVILENVQSSQFISALLLVAPYFSHGLTILWNGEQLSRPYVAMTVRIMQKAGAEIEWHGDTIGVQPGKYEPLNMTIPADWSAASFFYSFAIGKSQRTFHFPGLVKDGLQGDEEVAQLLEPFVHTELSNSSLRIASKAWDDKSMSFDLQDTPDLFQPLAFCMACNAIAAEFSGLNNLSLKESDRIAAVGTVLRSIGADISISENRFKIRPVELNYYGSPLPAFNDHRMAMAMVKLADIFPEIVIDNPSVVDKSFPKFWDALKEVGYHVKHIN